MVRHSSDGEIYVKKFGLGLIGLLIAGALVAGLTGIKLDQFKTMGEAGAKHVMPATPVNSFTAKEIDWAPELLAVGSVVAIKGTTITSEIEGTVTAIYFTPGGNIEKDQPLIKLNASVEEAQLNEAEVAAKWARIAFERAKELSKTRNISRAELDTAETNISQADAKVAYYKAIIAKKPSMPRSQANWESARFELVSSLPREGLSCPFSR